MRGAYLLSLIVSVVGLATIDRRLELAVFNKPKQTMKVMLISIIIFILWDILGIKLDIFFIGRNDYLTGLAIGEFPIEELFFLILLNYCSLLIYLGYKKLNKQK